MRTSRRSFVFFLGAVAFAPPGGLLEAVAQEGVSNPAPFDERERNILEALCEQIFPKDDFPGARDLGVATFIEQCIRQGHSGWTSIYRSGFAALETFCYRSLGKSFLDLGFDQQTHLMQRMEKGELDSKDWSIDQKNFFQMVRDHTMQGAYSHPKYGGNRNKGAWDMIGYYDFWTN